MRILGLTMFYAAGLVLLLFEVFWFYQWWGGIGAIIGLFVPPIAAVFPFIYLVLEGFSMAYFGIWAIGLGGAAIAGSGR